MPMTGKPDKIKISDINAQTKYQNLQRTDSFFQL
jgi:hypothetical protein